MNESNILSNNYDDKNKILTGTIEKAIIKKEDSKIIFSYIESSLNKFPDYTDYILDAEKASDINSDSFGYLVKAMGIVKKTSGYMVMVLKEEILQKFMLTNPEMFDFYAVFFNHDDAVKYILSKRKS